MKIEILQESLNKALSCANRFVPQKAQLPVLSNLLIEAIDGKIYVSGTNLESGVRIEIAGKIETEGAVIVNAKTISELIASFSKDKVEIKTVEQRLQLTCGKNKALVNILPPQEFPKIPEVKKEKGIELTSELLKDIINKVSFSSSQDETRPTLTGVLLDVVTDGVRIVATDGFRISILTQEGLSLGKDTSSLILPSKTLQELSKIISDFPQDTKGVNLIPLPESNQIIFWGEGFVLFCRLIEGKFPPYEKIIPSEFVVSATVDKENFLRAVKTASIFARESSNIVKIKTMTNSILISANAPQTGENVSEVESKTEGENLEVAFNTRYLIDFLNNLSSDEVVLRFSGQLNPAVFKNPTEEKYLHIIMPVRVQS